MSRRVAAAALTLTLLAAAGWALAQQGQPVVPPQDRSAPLAGPLVPPQPNDASGQPAPPRAGRLAQSGGPGRYAVVRLDKGAVLVDTATGKTWQLVPDADGRAAWVPTRRLDSEKDYRLWQDRRQQLGAAKQEEARAKARKAEDEARARQEAQRLDLEKARAAIQAEMREAQQRIRAVQVQQEQIRADQEQRLRALQLKLLDLQPKQSK